MKNNCYIDIGNTSIDILIGNKINNKNYYKYYLSEFKNVCKLLIRFNIDNVYISCVNSDFEKKLIPFLKENKITYKILDFKTMNNYSNEYKYSIPNLNILGYDLFCDLIAIDNNNGQIIIDLGTVTKILAINKDNFFLGGVLLPGIKSYSKGITFSTKLEIDEINNNNNNNNNLPLLNYETSDCVNSGTINGTIYTIKAMIEEIKKEYKLKSASVILTGGDLVYVIDRLKDSNYLFDKYLVLKGLIKIYNKKR